ncbi:hypothetical protein Dimus_001890 [Dionaea muscipula]
MASSSSTHTSKRRMVRSDRKPCDLCNRSHHGAACPVMQFLEEKMSKFSSRDHKRRDSSRPKRLTRQSYTTSPVTDKRFGRPPFLASRLENTQARRDGTTADGVSDVLDRRFERTTEKWFDDSFLDRGSEKTPDRKSGASQAHKEAKDKSHIQCFVCDQYGYYSTQCYQNPKARKYLRRGNHSEQHTPKTTEGGGHEWGSGDALPPLGDNRRWCKQGGGGTAAGGGDEHSGRRWFLVMPQSVKVVVVVMPQAVVMSTAAGGGSWQGWAVVVCCPPSRGDEASDGGGDGSLVSFGGRAVMVRGMMMDGQGGLAVVFSRWRRLRTGLQHEEGEEEDDLAVLLCV